MNRADTLHADDPTVFPAFVAQRSVRFRPDADPAETALELGVSPIPSSLMRAVVKRRNEFVAGRYCARQALIRLAAVHASASIDIGPSREPCFPAGFVGSITHADGLASAAVARASDARGVGIDIETWIEPGRVEEVRETIGLAAEYATLCRTTGWSLPEAVTLVFSAKESIYKCLFASVGRYFDFHDVIIHRVDTASGAFEGRLVTSLTAGLPEGFALRGRFERRDAFVATGIVLLADGTT